MLEYLARLAVSRGCVRLDWTAETSNPRALAFYDRLGARRVTEKIYFRVDGDMLQKWAAAGAQPANPIDEPVSG
jgi:ribosomal protein S18 acetylase RimI-like enzyme